MKQVLMSHFLFSFLAPSLRLSAGHYYWWGIDWQQQQAPLPPPERELGDILGDC